MAKWNEIIIMKFNLFYIVVSFEEVVVLVKIGDKIFIYSVIVVFKILIEVLAKWLEEFWNI